MKKTAFITAEYNPFHNGHLRQLDETKKAGAERVVVLMSGNFVQRGECALFSKKSRAEAAVRAGADLVLEIPLKYAVSGTSHFAYGAMKTALSTGLDGTVSFGAECDLQKLRTACVFLKDESVKKHIRDLCRCKGYSFPRAREYVTVDTLGSDYLYTISKPNNILALQYMSEAADLNAPFDFFAVKRTGAEHDGTESFGEKNDIASALLIRKNLTKNKRDLTDISRFVPAFSFEIIRKDIADGKYIDEQKYSLAVMSRLMQLDKSSLFETNGISHGLENVFYEKIRSSLTISELCSAVKSKRYTFSRLRQCCLSAALGIKRSDLDGDVPFVNVLGFNETGRKMLHEIHARSAVPFVGLLSQTKKLCPTAARDIEIMENAEYLYNLCLDVPDSNFSPYKFKPFISE